MRQNISFGKLYKLSGKMGKKIKYLIMDVDGTLTDGKIYMGEKGEAMKAFNVKDGAGISLLLPGMGVTPVIITARESRILENRCKELGIDRLYQNVQDKAAKLEEIIQSEKCEEDFACAYIGDDITDISVMEYCKQNGGYAGCPADAVGDIKRICDFISGFNGGDGAVREFIEWINKNTI